MAFFVKVFCEAVGMVIVPEGCFVLSVSRGETSTSLSDIRLVAFGAGVCMLLTVSICPRGGFWWVSRFSMVFLVQRAILRSVCLKT